MSPTYLDYNATTPIDPRVFEAMRPFLEGGSIGEFGNPSSSHAFGHLAPAAVQRKTSVTVSVDLAYRKYGDFGVAVLIDDSESITVEFVKLADRGLADPPDPSAVARALLDLCHETGASVLLLDGPQAWKDPSNGLIHQRRCERTLLTPAKTGLPGEVKPGGYGGFVRFSIAVFDALREAGACLLSTNRVVHDNGRLLVLESFPFAGWKGLGMRHLPAKGSATREDLRIRRELLVERYRLRLASDPSHDELQSLIAGLAGVAIGRGDATGYRVVGSDLVRVDGSWREGFIVIPSSLDIHSAK